MVYKKVLSNGIRVVAEKMTSVKSVSIGLWVNVGSRDEEPEEHGISHFLEHMFFKGTEHRSAKDIAMEIDAIGGELNAFTSRESTTFYAKVLDEHLPQAIDILSDNFHFSKFNRREIEREKQVVIEEIKMVEDDPEDFVHDLYIKDIWKGNPLARPILGTEETVSGITRKKILRFLKRTYDPREIVISVAGRFDPSSLMALLEESFGDYSPEKTALHPRQAPEITPHFHVKKRKLEQVHICIGTPGLPQGHPDRYALYVMNNVLGGGVSSRLFQEIRERRGWAYTIYSYPSSYQDGGLLTVYAGASIQNAPRVIEHVIKELKKVKKKGVKALELERSKNHIKGNLMLSMESTSSRMSKLAKDELYFGRSFTFREIIREIDKVSLEQVRQLSDTLLDSGSLSLTALGKINSKMLPQSRTL
ncbi:MAG: M16 family metallopeptidase [Nitrospiria bacterium]